MKKTLAAVAVLGAFAGSALAADVTLYGKVDLGLQYVHSEKVDGTKTDAWGLKSGSSASSRWGIKGSEQISEGLTVGFQLEDGIKADDGTTGDMFDREARLYVATDFGTLHMGRFGALDSGAGSLNVASKLTSMGTGYGDTIGNQGNVMKTYSRNNNSIAYTSPKFGGVTVSAMASLGDSQKAATLNANGTITAGEKYGDGEGSSDTDRYYGVAVQGQWEALGAGLVVSQLDRGHEVTANADLDDAYNVTAGVNYDFGVAKAYLAANYYDSGKKDVDQWGTVVSVAAPVGAATVEAMVGYGVESNADVDNKILTVGGIYKYPLSKRTYVYAAAGYTQEDADDAANKVKTTEVVSGICHNF